jgi:hypothetical protein
MLREKVEGFQGFQEAIQDVKECKHLYLGLEI